jgi:hypothetical protein
MLARRNTLTSCIALVCVVVILLYLLNLYIYTELKHSTTLELSSIQTQVDTLKRQGEELDIQLMSIKTILKAHHDQLGAGKHDGEEGRHDLPPPTTKQTILHSKKAVPSFNIENPRESDVWWRSRLSRNDNLIVFAISTLPRVDPNGKPLYYLKDTCESLLKQLMYYDSIFPNSPHSIKVYVQNSDVIQPHVVFDELVRDSKFSNFFIFQKVVNKKNDPFEDVPGHDYTAPNNVIPGRKARQQSCDVISLEENAFKALNYDYFVYLEDDFLTCEKAVVELVRSLAILEKSFPNFCGVRFSYGMNAIVLPRDTARAYSTYLEKHLKELPIDDLFHRFTKTRGNDEEDRKSMCAPNGRILFNYRNIMWEHIGDISTFSERNKSGFRSQFPRCNVMSVEIQRRCATSPDMLDPC